MSGRSWELVAQMGTQQWPAWQKLWEAGRLVWGQGELSSESCPCSGQVADDQPQGPWSPLERPYQLQLHPAGPGSVGRILSRSVGRSPQVVLEGHKGLGRPGTGLD